MLKSRRWVLLLLPLIVLVDVLLYRHVVEERHHALVDAEAVLQVSAEVVRGRMDQLLDTYDRTLTGVGEVIAAQGGLHAGNDLYLHRLLVRRHAITPGLRWLFVVGHDGQLAVTSSDFPSPRADLGDREYFQAAMQSRMAPFYIGPLLTSRVYQGQFVPVSRGVVSDANELLGVAAAGVEPAEFVRLLSEQALPDGYSLHLLLNSGDVLTCFPSGGDCKDRNWADDPHFRQWQEGALRARFPLAGPGAGFYARSERYPFLVVATYDQNRILERWRQGLPTYWLFGLGGNLLLLVLVLFSFRQLQRRREALAALEDANRRLESRVQERTAELYEREVQSRIFMNTALDAVVVIDGNGRIQKFNRAAERMFGYQAEEVMGRGLEMLMPESFAATHQQHVQAANHQIAVRAMGRGREVLGRCKDGREFPIEVSVGSSNEAGGDLHVGIIRDISERKAVEAELQRMATTDGLTGLLNRRAFTGEAERLLALAHRHAQPCCVMMLDADRFKRINDTYGHPVGDRVLKALAHSLVGELRQTDLVGRLGGEEFGVLLPGTDAAGGEQLGQRVLQAIRSIRLPLDEGELSFTISIGAALSAGGDDLEAIMQRADAALYVAKEGGRDRRAWEGWQPPAA